jgi:lantibiotic modifying enzyme
MKVGLALNDSGMIEQSLQLLQRLTNASEDDDSEFDIVSGRAGAIAAFIILFEVFANISFLECAKRLGDDLLRKGQRTDRGCSWRLSAFPKQCPLTGFSHGAAGSAYALVELAHVTGDHKYKEGAELAFQYELYWLDPEAENWPDLRGTTTRSRKTNRSKAHMTHWCHGAPGIALSRLRAYELYRDPNMQRGGRNCSSRNPQGCRHGS